MSRKESVSRRRCVSTLAPLALEPRFLLDAAGTATLVEVAHDATATLVDLAGKTDTTANAAASGADDGLLRALGEGGSTNDADPQPREVAFIDAGVPNIDTLMNVLDAEGLDFFVLDAHSDGLAQIAAHLEGQENISAVHIFSHGAQAQLRLGDALITSDSLTKEHADSIRSIGQSLQAQADETPGDILIYGCDFAGNEAGSRMIDHIAELSGADIAASSDLTGNALLGGDWTLEVTKGVVETNASLTSSLANDYSSLLSALPIIDLDADNGSGLSDGSFRTTFYANGAAIDVVDSDASITDTDDTTASQMQITVSGLLDGASEALVFAGDASTTTTVTLGATSNNNTITVNGTTFDIDFDGTTFTVSNDAGGNADIADYQDLLRGIDFTNISPSASSGERSLAFTITDASGDTSAAATSTIVVSSGGTPDISLNGVFAYAGIYSIWFFNDAGDPFRGDPITAGMVSSTVDATAGAGLTMSDDSTRLVVTNVDADTFEEAVINDEYLELAFTVDPSTDALLLFEGLIRRVGTIDTLDSGGIVIDPGIPDVADEYPYQLAMQVSSNASFDDAVTIFEDTNMTEPGQSTTDNVDWGDQDWVTKPGETYYFRFYFYDVTSSAGEAAIDDIGFQGLTVTRDFARTFNEGDSPILVGAGDGYANDFAENDITELQIVAANVGEPAEEVLRIGGTNFALDTDVTTPVTVSAGGSSLDVTFDSASGTFTIVETGGGVMPDADLTTLINTMTYQNVSTDPTAGDRTLTFNVSDGNTVSPDAVATITVVPDPTPTLDLDDDDSEGTLGADFANTYSEGGPAVALSHDDAEIDDTDSTLIQSASISVGGVVDGSDEVLIFNGDGGTSVSVPLNGPSLNDKVIITGNLFDIDFDGTTFTVTLDGGGDMALTDVELMIERMTYINNAADPTIGDRTFDFVVEDPDGNVSNTARSTITVENVNDPPTADDETINADESDVLIVLDDSADDILVGDDDPDNDTLSITHINGAAYVTGSILTLASGARVTVNANGSYIYDPNGVYEALSDGDSTTDSFTYTITDGNGEDDTATVTITINGENDAPDAADNAVTTVEDTDHVFALAEFPYSDAESDPALFIRIDTLPADGTLLFNSSPVTAPLLMSVTDINKLVFRPAEDESGTDYATFDFSVSDGNSFSPSATMTVHVTPENDPPTADDEAVTIDEDTIFIALNGSSDDVLIGDDDPDGDALSITELNGASYTPGTSVTLPSGATLILNSNGSYIYNPNGAFETLDDGDSTTDSYTYSITDGNMGTATATVTLTIEGVNDAPTATDNAVTTPEDQDYVFAVADFPFNDVDGDTLSQLRIDTVPTDGTLYINGIPVAGIVTISASDIAANKVVFRPDPNENGNNYATFDFSLSDGDVFSPAATMTVNVTPDVDPPVADDDSGSFTGTAITIDVVDGDVDPDDGVDPTSVVITSNPSGTTLAPNGKNLTVPDEGTWSVNTSTGAITFTPNSGFTGQPTAITYTIDDIAGNSSNTATVTLSDDANPVATNDTGTFTGTPITVPVTGNDTTSETVAPATVVITSNPSGSTLAPDGKSLSVPNEGLWSVDVITGDIRFTPASGFSGLPTPINYTVDDPSGNTSNAAQVSLSDGAPPVAADDTEPFTGIPVNVDVTDNDDAGEAIDPTSVVITANPAGTTLSPNGKTLTVPDEGVWTVDLVSGIITFTPETDFTGLPAAITYTVDDQSGNTSGNAIVTLTDAAAPVADDDTGSFTGSPVTLTVTTNDNTGETVDPATVVITSVPSGASLSADGKVLTVPNEGEWRANSAGQITFTPSAGFTDEPTPITYTVEDLSGNISNAATVSLSDDALPLAVDDAASFTGIPVTIGVVSNDQGGETVDPTTVIITSTPAGGTLSLDGKTLTVPDEGEWSVDTITGEITFDPEAGFVTLPTPITYTVADTDGNVSNVANVRLADNVPPIATNDSDTFTGAAVTVDVTSNDNTGGASDPSTVRIASNPAGTALSPDARTLTVPDEGIWTVNPINGAITFTPETDFTGLPTPIEYTVDDSAGNRSNQARVDLSDAAPPVANNDAGIFTGAAKIIDVTANDNVAEPVDPTSVVITSNPSGTTLSPDGSTLTVPGEGVWSVDPSSGDITFTPEPAFTAAPAVISYTVDDTSGNASNTATITLSVGMTPITANDTAPFSGSPVTLNVVANDTAGDAPDPSTVVITSNPSGTTLAPDGKSLIVPGEGEWSVDSSGNITFTPEANFSAAPTPITYIVESLDGTDSGPAAVILTDAAPPSATDDAVAAPPGPVTVDVTANDEGSEPVDETSVEISSNPPGSTLSTDGKTLNVPGEGTWTVDAISGAITFTPEAGFVSAPTPIEYVVEDADGNAASATVTVTYGPQASDDNPSNIAPGTFTLDPTANDTGGDPVVASTLELVTPGSGTPARTVVVPGQGTWTVTPSGRVVFSPELGFTGDPTPIEYQVANASGDTDTAMITLDYGPVAQDDSAPYDATPTTVDVLDNDENVDPSTLRLLDAGGNAVTTYAVPNEGTWVVDSVTGSLTFSPLPGFTDDPSPVGYQIADDDGNVANATVTLGLAPIAQNDTVSDVALGPVSVDPTANDIGGDPVDPSTVRLLDPNGLPVNTLVVPGEGTWSVAPATGIVTFTPVAGFAADPTPVRYQVEDAGGTTVGATIAIEYALPIDAVPENLLGLDAALPIVFNSQGPFTALPTIGELPFPVSADGIVVDAVRNLSALNGIASISAEGIVIAAVNGARALGSTSIPIAADGVVLEVVEQLKRHIHDARDNSALARGHSAFEANDRRGYSLRLDARSESPDPSTNAAYQLVLDSILDDQSLYVQLRHEINQSVNPAEKTFGLQMPDGAAVPEWINIDAESGLIIAELPVGLERLELRVWVLLGDGRLISRDIVFDGRTGQMQALPSGASPESAGLAPFDSQIRNAHARTDDAVASLAAVLAE